MNIKILLEANLVSQIKYLHAITALENILSADASPYRHLAPKARRIEIKEALWPA
jgi:hypothetical protein